MAKTRKAQGVDAHSTSKRGNAPPEQYWWKKGSPSPNPKGRPRSADIRQFVKEFAAEDDRGKTRLRQWLEMADRRARQGSSKHLELLLAYGYGRPIQAVDVTTQTLTPEQYLERIEEALAVLPAEDNEQPSDSRIN
ncbi:MAG: hypothetical protein WB460_15090 [Candidatus Acidiferrales bacterium]